MIDYKCVITTMSLEFDSFAFLGLYKAYHCGTFFIGLFLKTITPLFRSLHRDVFWPGHAKKH